MKANYKAGRSWVPNTFRRMYLSSELSPRLVPLCMDSKLVPGPKNQVETHFSALVLDASRRILESMCRMGSH